MNKNSSSKADEADKKSTVNQFKKRIVPGLIVFSILVIAVVLIFIFAQNDKGQKSRKDKTSLNGIRPQEEKQKKASEESGLISGGTDVEKDRTLRKEQLDEAMRIYRTFPENDNAVYLTGLIYEEQGNTTKAIELWKEAVRLDQERSDAYCSLGHAMYLKGHHEKTAEYLKKSLEVNPGMFKSRFFLAKSYSANGQFKEVVSVLEGHMKNNANGFVILGRAYQQIGSYKKAKEAFLKAIDLKKDHEKAYYGLITVCARLKEMDNLKKYRSIFKELKSKGQKEGRDSRRQYDSLAVTRKSVAHTHADLGRVYLFESKPEEAEKLFKRASELDSSNTQCRLYLARLYQKTGRVEKAVFLYKELTGIAPENGLYHYNLGNVYFQSKKEAEAEASFKRSVELAPERSEGYSALAQFYIVTGRDAEKAVYFAEQAVEKTPISINYYILSQAYEKNGDINKAIGTIRKAIAENPNEKKLRQRYLQLIERR